MNIQARQLTAFLEVARLQSFTKAAEQVHLSQAGLSMLIKELEGQVGARLFDRTTRSVALTDAGRLLKPVAERTLGELAQVRDAIEGVSTRGSNRLRIAATPMVSASLLPSVFRTFRAQRSQVSLQLADVEVGEVRRRVLDGEVDIGLGFFVKPAVGMARTSLFRFRLMLVSPAQAANTGLEGSRAWHGVAGLRMIGLPHDNPIQSLIDARLRAAGHTPEPVLSINFLATIISMAEAGVGHAIVPSFALPHCAGRRVAIRMLSDPEVHLDLFLVERRGAGQKAAAKAFIAELKRAAASLPG